jgi:hypothetical protein
MADGVVQTDMYPKAGQNSFLDTMSQVQALKNAGVQNQLLQTETQRQGVGLSQDKITLAHQGFQWLSQGLGSLAQDPRIATPAGPAMLKQFAAQGVQQGWLTPDVANAEIANMPTDPAQLPQYVQNLNVRAQDAAGQFAQIYGTPGTIPNGNNIIPVATSPIMGVKRIGANIPMQTSPGERAQLVPGTDAQGRPTLTPAATVLQNAGMNPLNAQPLTAPAPSPANQLQPYPQGQAPVPAGQAPGNGGSVPMGPPAGVVGAQTKAADISAEKYSTDAAAQTNYQQNIMPIQQAYEHVKALGTTGIGPGSEELNQAKSFLVTMGVINPDAQLSDFDQANKYLSAAMRSNGYTGSDAQLDAAAKASPTMKTSQGAALAVLQKTAAMARMQNAQVQAFQASGQGPESYSKWAAGWNAKQNAAAYAFDMMDPTQRQAYVKTLSASELTKFKASLGTAMQLGLVTPPQAAQGN